MTVCFTALLPIRTRSRPGWAEILLSQRARFHLLTMLRVVPSMPSGWCLLVCRWAEHAAGVLSEAYFDQRQEHQRQYQNYDIRADFPGYEPAHRAAAARTCRALHISFHNESVGTATGTVHGCHLEALALQSLQSAYRHLQLGHTRGHHIWLHRFIHCRRNCRHELPVRQGPRHVDVWRVLVVVRRKGGQHLVTKAECERAGPL